jgi:hypothetical protein
MERNDNFIWLLAAMPTTVAFHFNCEAIIFTPLQPSEALNNSLQEKPRNDLLMNGMRRK